MYVYVPIARMYYHSDGEVLQNAPRATTANLDMIDGPEISKNSLYCNKNEDSR